MKLRPMLVAVSTILLSACGSGAIVEPSVVVTPPPPLTDLQIASTNELETFISNPDDYLIPMSNDFDNIPQDPLNRITASKVKLGKLLFHETGVTGESVGGSDNEYSCASCHQHTAGFKSGNAQGIGDGGVAFGVRGEMRMANTDLEDVTIIDHQPIASPTVLNVAYQDVMLWNGQFGNSEGSINTDVDTDRLMTMGTPKTANLLGLSGVETQAVAGIGVHRLMMGEGSIVTTNPEYVELVEEVREENEDVQEVSLGTLAALSIAAFERTILANESPFQQWLRGDKEAMTEDQVKGATVFFGKGQCSACHSGPALSSPVGASSDEMFMSIGFADLDAYNEVHSVIPEDQGERLGRGGLTGNPADNYKFKIPTLYNLAQSEFLGHGNSFRSVREVVEYKNNGIPENPMAENIDPRFKPLYLSQEEVDYLVAFIEGGLKDDNLQRYVPEQLPSGQCVINNDYQSRLDLGCE